MQPLSLDEFQYWWQVVDQENPMIDETNVEYKVIGNDEGLFKVGTEERYGPIRYVDYEIITEYTAKDNVFHGLARWIAYNYAYVGLWGE